MVKSIKSNWFKLVISILLTLIIVLQIHFSLVQSKVVQFKKYNLSVFDKTMTLELIQKSQTIYFQYNGKTITASITENTHFIDLENLSNGVEYVLTYDEEDYSDITLIAVGY